MQKKYQKIWSIQKKAVLLHPLCPNLDFGVPENFNFWGEREQGEDSYERHSRESY